ncbi:hypothetical protein YK48G_23640 [Lentilactobacillus fungorum]|uniref:Surface layer protein A domain-containing protein n=1 Tax=Lentilactobacillus fungorum TaxID=2201250 RepID=A0ABQ3W343_9LACO|nr:hypothetical protein [Lentilactobacillus fungorum]GHP14939.1 hypothetical protein YK48G_23640 [Lentilactobacillus fungorum]
MRSNTSHLAKQLTIMLGIGAAMFLASTISAHAYTSLANNSNIQYVKVKRPLFTGQYTKVNGKKGHKIITPKGTILKVEGVVDTPNNHQASVQLSRGAISYQKQQRIYQATKPSSAYIKPYTTKYFTPYKLRLPVRTQALQAGQGFTNTQAGYYKPIFYITLDGYLQYYTTARLKHYGIQNSWESTKEVAAVDNPIWTIKPSAAEKISSFKSKGNTSYIYYKQPIKGLPQKKVSARNYRLTIKKGQTRNHTWHYGDEDFRLGIWTPYNVGGQPFYNLVEVSEGD